MVFVDRRWIATALFASLLLSAAPAFAQSRLIFSGSTSCRDIALTYDVEFGNTTQDLADMVDSLGIRTTWFFLGDSVDSYPEITQQVAARHFVGNHTLNHPEMPRLSPTEMRRQILQAEANIEAISGVNPSPFWRPPYGSYNSTVLEVAEEAGYDYTIMWSIDTEDWNGPSVQTIRRRIVDNAEPGAIVLQHGFPPNSVEATRLAVSDLRQMGYQFVTVPEIMGLTRTQRDFGGDTYVIQPGDSFTFIGRCHNVTGPRVQAYNDLDDIPPGITLSIPHVDEIIVSLAGERLTFPVYPRLAGAKSLAHVRLAERLGALVTWDGARVIVTKGGNRIEITPEERIALVNGSPVDMGGAAVWEGERVMAPVRFIAERMGYTVQWDDPTWTVRIQ
ncbi:MAG TPA: polysaccharide deacetylase family protein [Symbiobacteriaceae bacterium]|nr:polysaccharide deacetylase family protein [Symbiobacteriaceae bacterium]